MSVSVKSPYRDNFSFAVPECKLDPTLVLAVLFNSAELTHAFDGQELSADDHVHIINWLADLFDSIDDTIAKYCYAWISLIMLHHLELSPTLPFLRRQKLEERVTQWISKRLNDTNPSRINKLLSMMATMLSDEAVHRAYLKERNFSLASFARLHTSFLNDAERVAELLKQVRGKAFLDHATISQMAHSLQTGNQRAEESLDNRDGTYAKKRKSAPKRQAKLREYEQEPELSSDEDNSPDDAAVSEEIEPHHGEETCTPADDTKDDDMQSTIDALTDDSDRTQHEAAPALDMASETAHCSEVSPSVTNEPDSACLAARSADAASNLATVQSPRKDSPSASIFLLTAAGETDDHINPAIMELQATITELRHINAQLNIELRAKDAEVQRWTTQAVSLQRDIEWTRMELGRQKLEVIKENDQLREALSNLEMEGTEIVRHDGEPMTVSRKRKRASAQRLPRRQPQAL